MMKENDEMMSKTLLIPRSSFRPSLVFWRALRLGDLAVNWQCGELMGVTCVGFE